MNFLDFSIKSPEERIKYINDNPNLLKEVNLSFLSDYILSPDTKQEKDKNFPIISNNRYYTIKNRELPTEDIFSIDMPSLSIYKLDYKEKLSEKDKENPQIKEQLQVIESMEKLLSKTTIPKKRYLIKKQIIEIWKTIYIIKASSMNTPTGTIKLLSSISIPDSIYIENEKGVITPKSKSIINLLTKEHIYFLLSNYSKLKMEVSENLTCDLHYLLIDLENLIIDTFTTTEETEYHCDEIPELFFPSKQLAIYWDILLAKVDGCSNLMTKQLINSKWGQSRTEQYFSTVFCQTIPNLILKESRKQHLIYYYTNCAKGTYKVCSKCGKTLLAHPYFFSRNNGSCDGYYSICKECRKKKRRK